MLSSFDILVVGAGFAGASTAFHLARQSGLRLLVVEREARGGMHASGKNAALLRQAAPSLETAQHIQETRAVLLDPPRDFSRRGIFSAQGSLLLGEARQLQHLHRVLEEAGGKAEFFLGERLPPRLDARLVEILRHGEYQALLASPGDGVVDVAALLENYLTGAQGHGARVQTSCEVKRVLRESGGWRVETSQGTFLTRVLVNAAGPWARGIAGGVACRAPEMLSFRRHLFMTQAPVEMNSAWPFVWDLDREFYFRPDAEGCLMCPGDEDPHPDVAPECDPEAPAWLRKKSEAFHPGWQRLAVHRFWSCLRSKTPSGSSHVGWDAAEPSLFWVCGLGGHGMSASYGIGRAAADRLLRIFDAKSEKGGQEKRDGAGVPL